MRKGYLVKMYSPQDVYMYLFSYSVAIYKKKLYNHIFSRVNSKGVLQKRTNQLHVVMKNLH